MGGAVVEVDRPAGRAVAELNDVGQARSRVGVRLRDGVPQVPAVPAAGPGVGRGNDRQRPRDAHRERPDHAREDVARLGLVRLREHQLRSSRSLQPRPRGFRRAVGQKRIADLKSELGVKLN